jgi:methionyl-tRNA synthetase
VNRTLTFVARYYDGVIPAADGLASSRADIRAASEALRDASAASVKRITELLEWAELRDAFKEAFALSSIANKAFQDGEPWKNRTADPEKAEALLHDLCYLIRDLMILVHPYIPAYADRVAEFFGCRIWSGFVFDESAAASGNHPVALSHAPAADTLGWKDLGSRCGLSTVSMPEIIFKPMDDATANMYRERYAGSQKERKEKESQKMAENAKDNKAAQSPSAAPAAEAHTPTVAPDALFNEKIALKTAKIVKVERHADAEKLYIETLDDGSGTERVIVSGLVPYLTEAELLGKSIIIADNLKPRKMRGVESKGMLLAGDYTSADGVEHVEVLDSSWAAPGTPVILEGADPAFKKPDSIDADTFFAAPMLIVDHEVRIGGKKLMIAGKPVTTLNVVNGEVH